MNRAKTTGPFSAWVLIANPTPTVAVQSINLRTENWTFGLFESACSELDSETLWSSETSALLTCLESDKSESPLSRPVCSHCVSVFLVIAAGATTAATITRIVTSSIIIFSRWGFRVHALLRNARSLREKATECLCEASEYCPGFLFFKAET